MEKSNGIKIGIIVATLGLLFYSSVIIQISFAEEIALRSVGKGDVSCKGGEEISNVRISFLESSNKGTSFAEWNIDHEKYGSAGGIITSIQATSESFFLK